MDGQIMVRQAIVADARGIARVLVDGWQATYAQILPADFLAAFNYDRHEAGARHLLDTLAESSAVFVAVVDGGVVGVAHVRELEPHASGFSAELDAIYVLPSLQRRRVGSRLLYDVVRWLKARGRQSMFLWVLRDNPHQRFYDRVGGELLSDEKQDDYGGTTVTSVAYGWRDLDELNTRLEKELAAELR